MTKKGIYNEQTFRGRWKGNTDTRVYNKHWEEGATRCKLGGHSVYCTQCETQIYGTRIECEIHLEICDGKTLL
jgi:hypothetical protein